MKLQEQTKATYCVIWLHGLGADGSDFAPIVPELQLPTDVNIKFIFPDAPIMPVTINGGYKMRAWFDIYESSLTSQIDEAGIANAKAIIENLIAQEVTNGIPTENIMLAGFSQGAVIALITGLCYPKRLGGVIALSGFLPMADRVLTDASAENKHMPVFVAHGTQDPMVPFELGEATAQLLKNMHYPVTWHAYPMGHSVCGEEVRDISEWLIKNKRQTA